MVKEIVFKPQSIDDNAFLLAAHMPQGRLWESSFDPDSNIGKLIRGLSIEFYRLQVLTNEISTEMDIDQTEQLIDEWFVSVGIPNDCFDTGGTLAEKREKIRLMISNFGGVQKAEDFVRVADLFGIPVEVFPGNSVGMFPLTFPLVFFESATSSSHTIFVRILQIEEDVDFPLPFPIPFTSGSQAFLQCIFDQLAPANVQVVFISEDIT